MGDRSAYYTEYRGWFNRRSNPRYVDIVSTFASDIGLHGPISYPLRSAALR